MSINKEKPHLIICVEDDANRQIINGFTNCLNVNRDNVKTTTERGWLSVLNKVKVEYIPKLQKYPDERILMVIDFDDDFENRLKKIKEEIGTEYIGRIFVLGAKSEPEDIKRKLNRSFEDIGKILTENCPGAPNRLWDDVHLAHNHSELTRLVADVGGFLFN